MDFSTVGSKLNSGQYSEPQDFIEDMTLIFNNSFCYNSKNPRVCMPTASLVPWLSFSQFKSGREPRDKVSHKVPAKFASLFIVVIRLLCSSYFLHQLMTDEIL